jgi:ubiquinone/menaquinone biosynthesis C-methylase UbiE
MCARSGAHLVPLGAGLNKNPVAATTRHSNGCVPHRSGDGPDHHAQEADACKTGGNVNDRYVPAAGRALFTPLYDAVNAMTMRQGRWRPRIVERALSGTAPTRILDLGCGTGAMALALAEASPSATVIGVDGDPEVLERARAKARAEGIELELHEALADRLPIPDANVQCVVSTLVFHHLAPAMKRDALMEVRRVLEPGGRLLICDLGRPNDPVMRAAFFAVQLLDGFANTRAHARGELPEIVSQAGFSSVTAFARYRTGGGALELIEALRPTE